ncbi:MAG: hypothetical protein D3926_15945 [Desulfobacteraceae bacterium]|nr:MAG: hypothetical protein D3926_15945 [Desulfobacteraceae bacterium]
MAFAITSLPTPVSPNSRTRNSNQQLFGKKRFFEVVRQNYKKSANEIVRSCFNTLSNFRGNLLAHDDITLVVIKRKGTLEELENFDNQ